MKILYLLSLVWVVNGFVNNHFLLPKHKTTMASSYLNVLEKRNQMSQKRASKHLPKNRKIILHPETFDDFNSTTFLEKEVVNVAQNRANSISKWSDLLGMVSVIKGKNETKKYHHRLSKTKDVSSDGNHFTLESDIHKYNFSHVGGYYNVKAELLQIIEFLRHPQKYTQYGVRLPRGILLEGPTGNGKTLIARCIAGEAGVNFVACSGSEFMEKYVGVGAARIRELFKFVEKHSPCILFIDEFDALAKTRSYDGESSNSERDQTLNQLLVLMDGFKNHDNAVVVVAATNRKDILDPASIRPGRFDKIIHVPNPDSETRAEIIQIHSANKPMNISQTETVKMTSGLNGAQIENMLNEATLQAIRTNTLPVNLTHLEHVRDKILLGESSSIKRNVSEKTLLRIAVHEVGHLMMALQSDVHDKPSKITIDSINPRQSLGYVIFEPDENHHDYVLREYIQDKIKVLLGGRAAEEVVYGSSVSSGAFSDLEKAFIMARTMVMEYGMGTKIIYPYMSEIYKRQIDENIHLILLHLYTDTVKYIKDNRSQLDIFVNILLTKKTLVWDEIQNIYDSQNK